MWIVTEILLHQICGNAGNSHELMPSSTGRTDNLRLKGRFEWEKCWKKVKYGLQKNKERRWETGSG